MSPKYDSDSDQDEVEELANQLQEIDIDTSKLTPLSPEVISKQVSR
jgi:translation initiation factor 2 subunit 3